MTRSKLITSSWALTALALAATPAWAISPADIGEPVDLRAAGQTFYGDMIASGDLDGDGDTDLLYSTINHNQTSFVASNNGDGTFDGSVVGGSALTRGNALGDLDGDGDLDAVFIQDQASGPLLSAEVWWNDGAANFTQGPTLATSINIGDERCTPVLVRDLDGDGDADVLVASNQYVKKYTNDGQGNFTEELIDLFPGFYWDWARSLAMADLTGDGIDDLFVTAWTTGLFVAPGDGLGGFGPAVRYTTPAGFSGRNQDADLGDIDGDGDIDVLVEVATQPQHIWLNDGSGVLSHMGKLEDGVNTSYASWAVGADLDADGDMDVLQRYGRVWESDGGSYVFYGRLQRNGSNWNGLPSGLADLDSDGVLEAIYGAFVITTNAPAGGGGGACDDVDGDGVCDADDICDGDDATGDSDSDGVCDDSDLCLGDDQSGDTDFDGVCDASDNCPTDANADQSDMDGDAIGDVCEADSDADGTIDDYDNCPTDANPDQADSDGDFIGDVCDPDDDNDGVADTVDNCALIPNSDQADFDNDGAGDVCDGDDDDDGVLDGDDVCPGTPMDVVYNADGCSGAQLVEAEAPCAGPWASHGQYVSAVTQAANQARNQGLLSNKERAAIVRGSARSSCGQ